MKYSLLAAALFVSGCQFYSLPPGVLYACDGNTCEQPGFVCRSDGLCHPQSDPSDAGVRDGGAIQDGGNDAGPIDAGEDAGLDAGGDAGFDAGPAQCGPLGDGGRLECSALETCGGAGVDGGGRPGFCARDTRFCTEDNWCWELPSPQGNTLRAVSAYGNNDVWMVGDHGTILRRENGLLYRVRSPTHLNLYGVFAAGPDDVWIVGEGGLRLHLFQGTWRSNTPDSITPSLRAVTRDLSGKIWAVGDDCTLASTTDGLGWLTDPKPLGCDNVICNLYALIPSATGGLHAGGGGSEQYWRCAVSYSAGTWTVLTRNFDGTIFQSIVEYEGAVLYGSASGVFELASDGGLPIERTANPLTAIALDPAGMLWGASGTNADGGDIEFLTDAGWEAIPLRGKRWRYLGLDFTGNGQGHAVGLLGNLAKIDPGPAKAVSEWNGASSPSGYTDVWASDVNAVHAVGEYGLHGERFGSGAWVFERSIAYYPQDVWSPGGTDFSSVGGTNSLYTKRAGSLQLVPSVPDFGSVSSTLSAVWGFGSTDVLVGGNGSDAGVSRMYRGTGTPGGAWQTLVLPVDAGVNEIHGLADAGVAWAVAGNANGPVFFLPSDGGAVEVEAFSTAPLRGVWALGLNDVWTVGAGGYLAHKTDGGWNSLRSGTDAGLNSVWAQASGALMVGELGTVLRWDSDGGLAPEWSGTRTRLNGVSGLAGGPVWAVGDDQVILRRQP